MLLGLLLLRTDEQEIEDDDEDNHHQQRRHATGTAGRSTLCPGFGNQSVHALTLVGKAPPQLGRPAEALGAALCHHPVILSQSITYGSVSHWHMRVYLKNEARY